MSTTRELPTGRLASFEDDDTLDMASILGPRRTAPHAPPPETVTSTVRATDAHAPAPEAPQQKRRPSGRAPRANKIRSSTFHVPSRLVDLVVDHREQHGLSNGQIVVAAVEKAHPQLDGLIRSGTTGGSVFSKRATRAPRTQAGDRLVPLNVRLFEADFDVLDKLVGEFGASSRSDLVSVSLAAFFAA